MHNYSVYRLNSSPYQKEGFKSKEKSSFLDLGIKSYKNSLPTKFEDNSILITNTHTNLNLIQDTDQIKLIIHPNSGHENLEKELKRFRCPVIVGNSIRAQAVVNYILSCIFSRYSSIPSHKTWSDSRSWDRKLLSELKVLIIGHGHIGKILESSLVPISKKVFIHDPYKNKKIENLSAKGFDIIILAASLTSSSKEIINEVFLREAKKDLTLINSARGEHILLDDLLAFLKENNNAHAFLDVFKNEPFSIESLSDVENLTCTSHIAGVYKGITDKIMNFSTQTVSDFLSLPEAEFLKKYEQFNINKREINE